MIGWLSTFMIERSRKASVFIISRMNNTYRMYPLEYFGSGFFFLGQGEGSVSARKTLFDLVHGDPQFMWMSLSNLVSMRSCHRLRLIQ